MNQGRNAGTSTINSTKLTRHTIHVTQDTAHFFFVFYLRSLEIRNTIEDRGQGQPSATAPSGWVLPQTPVPLPLRCYLPLAKAMVLAHSTRA